MFKGILNNWLFCTILLVTSALQAIIVEFGSVAFHVAEDGLSARFWGVSLVLGVGSLPVQQLINLLYRSGLNYKNWRLNKRKARNAKLTHQRAPNPHETSETRLLLQHAHQETGTTLARGSY